MMHGQWTQGENNTSSCFGSLRLGCLKPKLIYLIPVNDDETLFTAVWWKAAMTFISVNPLEKIFSKNKMLEKTTHKKNKTLVSDVIKRGGLELLQW